MFPFTFSTVCAAQRAAYLILTLNSKLLTLQKKERSFLRNCVLFYVGAADEARTRYLHLGKVALYQMSYGRIKKSPKMGSVIFVGCPSPT